MAIAKSNKKEGSRRREPKRPEWSQGGPKEKRKTLVALQKNLGWADTQIEVGGARDESSCLRVGSVGEHLFLEGFWCLFSNKRVQYSQSWVENPAAFPLSFSGLVVILCCYALFYRHSSSPRRSGSGPIRRQVYYSIS